MLLAGYGGASGRSTRRVQRAFRVKQKLATKQKADEPETQGQTHSVGTGMPRKAPEAKKVGNAILVKGKACRCGGSWTPPRSRRSWPRTRSGAAAPAGAPSGSATS